MPNPALAQAGLNVAQDLVGTGMGLLLEGHNDRRQLRQQRRLQALQIQGQQQMGDYNYAKELQFWKDTNFQAQMEQLKMAGLNPALMYKQGGSGGMTIGTPASGGVQGASAPTGGMEVMNMVAQKAQIELIRAQTEKTKAEATKTAGADTTLAQTQTASLTQGIENQKAQQELTEIQSSIQRTEDYIKHKTQNAAIAIMMQEMREGYERMDIMVNEGQISDATKDEKIRIMELEVVGAIARNTLTKATAGKTTAETQNLAVQIAQKWEEIAIMKQQAGTAQTQAETQRQLADFETSFGGQAAGLLRTLVDAIPIKGKRTTTIKHTGGATNTTIHKRQ